MNILFLTMNVFTDIEMHNIYADLMKEFIRQGHYPYIVTPREKKSGEKTEVVTFPDHTILKVQIGNTSGVSFIEKGISTVTLDGRFYQAITKLLPDITFDLILYSTPPITLCGTISKLKRKHRCRTYLMLKDIFPQNAVDIGLFSAKSPFYRFFRAKERKLYRLSDRIGCMSPANVRYLLEHNPQLKAENVTVCPNAIEAKPHAPLTAEKRQAVREKYGIPEDVVTFVYGGNLGKPQDIPFLIECLKANANRSDRFFVICGTGSEYPLLEKYMQEHTPDNVLLLSGLPHDEYVDFIRALDAGLIMLDHRFTIPNFPSRLLSYMECAMPVLACTDVNTDIGQVITEGGFGWWCESTDAAGFTACVEQALQADIRLMGQQSRKYLEAHYTVPQAYSQIMDR